MERVQTIANHTRWHPLYHFILAPMVLIYFIYSIVRLVLSPGLDRAEYVFLAVALVILTWLVRLNSLRVQDRLIRLEERLRFEKVLSPELAASAMNLRTSHYIGLRFASDDQLEELVAKVVSGELDDLKEIKMAVKDWRPDFLRV